MANTPDKGIYRWLVFKKGNKWVGAVLEFNIVEVGNDPDVVLHNVQEAAVGYVESARKMKRGFREHTLIPMLNQETDPAYERLWFAATKSKEKRMAFPKEVFSVGSRNLAYALA